MKGDLQETFRHSEDAPIVLMDVEALLFNMAKVQCAMWVEEDHEAGAIGEVVTEAVWRRIPPSIIPPPNGCPPGTPSTHHPRQTYPRPVHAPNDNPATRDMHTEASEKRKTFLAARALLKVELVKIMGDEIAETIAADQADGTVAGMSCVDCMGWLE